MTTYCTTGGCVLGRGHDGPHQMGCNHTELVRWQKADGEPADKWSCVECDERFVPESKLEATEKERLDLLARVGYAEGAGEEGLRRWELAEERCKALSSRLGRAVELFNRYNLRPGEEGQQALCDLEDVLKGGVVERQSQKCGKQFLAGAIAGIKSCALTVGHEGSCANHE